MRSQWGPRLSALFSHQKIARPSPPHRRITKTVNGIEGLGNLPHDTCRYLCFILLSHVAPELAGEIRGHESSPREPPNLLSTPPSGSAPAENTASVIHYISAMFSPTLPFLLPVLSLSRFNIVTFHIGARPSGPGFDPATAP